MRSDKFIYLLPFGFFFLSAQEFIFYYYYSLLPYTKYTEMDIMELYNLMSISQVLETTVLACDSEVLY